MIRLVNGTSKGKYRRRTTDSVIVVIVDSVVEPSNAAARSSPSKGSGLPERWAMCSILCAVEGNFSALFERGSFLHLAQNERYWWSPKGISFLTSSLILSRFGVGLKCLHMDCLRMDCLLTECLLSECLLTTDCLRLVSLLKGRRKSVKWPDIPRSSLEEARVEWQKYSGAIMRMSGKHSSRLPRKREETIKHYYDLHIGFVMSVERWYDLYIGGVSRKQKLWSFDTGFLGLEDDAAPPSPQQGTPPFSLHQIWYSLEIW